MRKLRVPSALVAPRSEGALSPAMTAAVWEIADAVMRLKLRESPEDGLWLRIPTARLRGSAGRTDNVWLRECLERLCGVKLAGERNGDPWGAVLLAEWHLVDGGATAELFLGPAALSVLVAPATFAQLEADAVHRLPGHARRLYGLLADKRRLKQANWVFQVDELRRLMGVADRKSYRDFRAFRQFVLNPAVAGINEFGAVLVTMEPERAGRTVVAVRFAWSWRDPGEAAGTVAENARHSKARRRRQNGDDAPPLVPAVPVFDPASVDVAALPEWVRSWIRQDRSVRVAGVLVEAGSPAMRALQLALRAEPGAPGAGLG